MGPVLTKLRSWLCCWVVVQVGGAARYVSEDSAGASTGQGRGQNEKREKEKAINKGRVVRHLLKEEQKHSSFASS